MTSNLTDVFASEKTKTDTKKKTWGEIICQLNQTSSSTGLFESSHIWQTKISFPCSFDAFDAVMMETKGLSYRAAMSDTNYCSAWSAALAHVQCNNCWSWCPARKVPAGSNTWRLSQSGWRSVRRGPSAPAWRWGWASDAARGSLDTLCSRSQRGAESSGTRSVCAPCRRSGSAGRPSASSAARLCRESQ